MKKIMKDLVRRNKYLEIVAYIFQNNKLMNSSGEGGFSKNIDEMYEHFISISEKYVQNYSDSLKGKIVLEIGTGVTKVTMLYLIKMYDIKKAYCYDRFNCLDSNDEIMIKKYNLEKYLNKLEYITGTNDKIIENIEAGSIDYVVSNAVLEHVDNLSLLFKMLNEVLKSNGKMFHSVDLKCHNKFKKYGELYFHTFNNTLYNLMGDRIGQPNRKLVVDYLDIFEKECLNCKLNIKASFTNDTLQKAKQYLHLNDYEIKNYIASDVDFILSKKHTNIKKVTRK
jgi:SAM-dependent methyltransferase